MHQEHASPRLCLAHRISFRSHRWNAFAMWIPRRLGPSLPPQGSAVIVDQSSRKSHEMEALDTRFSLAPQGITSAS